MFLNYIGWLRKLKMWNVRRRREALFQIMKKIVIRKIPSLFIISYKHADAPFGKMVGILRSEKNVGNGENFSI
jgi:hypothetical protein